MKKLSKEWLYAALERALRTMGQTALGMLTIGAAFEEINWLHILSVAAVSGIYSLLTSMATPLPEIPTDGTLDIDTISNPEENQWKLSINDSLDNLSEKKKVVFKVRKDNKNT